MNLTSGDFTEGFLRWGLDQWSDQPKKSFGSEKPEGHGLQGPLSRVPPWFVRIPLRLWRKEDPGYCSEA